MVPSSELLSQIATRYPNVQRAPDELNDTARSWKIPGYAGSFGFISSMVGLVSRRNAGELMSDSLTISVRRVTDFE